MYEIKPLMHRCSGGGVVGLVLLAGQPDHTMTLGLQLAEQHLLVAQAIGKQLLIKSTVFWLLSQKQIAGLQLIPPSPDDGTAGKGGEFAWSDQASQVYAQLIEDQYQFLFKPWILVPKASL